MLNIEKISKFFNSTKVLNDISFSISKGKIFGIIGPNGAGKTTTLRIMLGILPPSSGQILFNDKTLDQNYQNITGYLPEERGLYPKSSVLNSLIYFAQLKGLNYSEANKKTNYWLERLDLKEYEKYHVEELSKGNQQKVQFISAILHKPQILILDEPFSGFDPVNQSIFREIIEEMKEHSYIILSTHLMDLAESLCDDIFMINKGKEVLSGELSRLLNSEEALSYEIVFSNKIENKVWEYLGKDNAELKNDNSLIVNLNSQNLNSIIKDLTDIQAIEEIKKIKATLHQLFISSVETK